MACYHFVTKESEITNHLVTKAIVTNLLVTKAMVTDLSYHFGHKVFLVQYLQPPCDKNSHMMVSDH